MAREQNYCGCCGRESVGEWCHRCQDHILKAPVPAWDRTYFAQFGRDCPYQIRDNEKMTCASVGGET